MKSNKKGNNSNISAKSRSKMLPAARDLEKHISNQSYWGRDSVKGTFPGVGFPDELHCTLKYVEDSIAFSGISPSAQVFRINSLFDPNLTGTGHQPMWFDQLCLAYGKYLVTAARVEAEIINLNTANGIAKCVALYDDIDNSANIVQELSESRYAKECISGMQTGSNAVQRLILPVMPIAKLFGQKNIESDPDVYSLTSTSPQDVGYYIFKAKASDGVNAMAITVNFTIYFDCIFKELQSPTSSLAKKQLQKILTPDSRNSAADEKSARTTVGVRDLPYNVRTDLPLQRNESIDRFRGREAITHGWVTS